jgi:hypothetical protein
MPEGGASCSRSRCGSSRSSLSKKGCVGRGYRFEGAVTIGRPPAGDVE